MHSKSLAELLHKILTFESTEVKESYLNSRLEILDAICDLINDDSTD